MSVFPTPRFTIVSEILVTSEARIFEHGWQSFAPATSYALTDRPLRPVSERNRILNYRQSSHPGTDSFLSEGVLTVDDGHGAVHVVAAQDPFTTGTRIAARLREGTLVVEADGPTSTTSAGSLAAGSLDAASLADDSLQDALGDWARMAACKAGIGPLRPAPTGWCSWYEYYGDVREEDIYENISEIGKLDLAVDVIQIDDGYQVEIGDWLTPSARFTDVRKTIDDIRASGRRAGIWAAPFFAGARSRLAAEHPDWLVHHRDGGVMHAGHNWNQDLYSVDLTHPGAADWMRSVFETFVVWGIDFFKIDFLAAGAIPGVRASGADPVTAYRDGLKLIRQAVGDAHILGCGAPVLPSVGLVDSLRVSADIDAKYEADDGDPSSPSQRGALISSRGRQFMNDVFFSNDPDCLITSAKVERRENWAQHVEAVAGAVVSSERLATLDDWGIDTTRRLLAAASERRAAFEATTP